MDLSLLGLAALALVDSTSFGTLLIPIWLLLTPGRVRAARLLAFLGTVAGLYLVVGVVLVAGAGAFLDRAAALGDSVPVAGAQAVLGAALLVGAFLVPGPKPEEAKVAAPTGAATAASAGATAPAAPGDGAGAGQGDGSTAAGGRAGRVRGGRVARWRDRAVGADGGGLGALIGLAVGAVALELATMLPYLAATGIIASADLTVPGRLAVLAAYCVVMVLPALALLGLRVVADERVRPVLERLGAWLERTGAETTAWVVGVVGFLLLRDAVTRLPGFLDWLG